MGNPPLIVGLLINGAAYAAIFMVVAFLISRFTSEIVWRSFLVLFLFIAAGLYVIFAVRAGESAFWVVGELVGVAIFGGMGLLGLRGSLWWLVGAWALHPLWDVGLHYLGPGRSLARDLYDRVPQLRPSGRRLHRHRLQTRTNRGRRPTPRDGAP